MTKTLSPKARKLIDKICELDEQYRGGVIKARNRDDFLNTHIVPLVENYANEVFQKRRTREENYCNDNPCRRVADCMHCGDECRA